MQITEQWKSINEFVETIPVNLSGLCSALGVRLRFAYLSDDISGMLENLDGIFSITVNASHPETRQRFTIAHELGHYMLHRALIGDGIDDDKAYRSTDVGKYHNTLIGPREETEANKFAATLLMPDMKIKEMADNVSISELARKFGVSEQSMAIRLGRHG